MDWISGESIWLTKNKKKEKKKDGIINIQEQIFYRWWITLNQTASLI